MVMKKTTKGALAIGAGVVLLIGGGGSLAVWNQSVGSEAGTLQAGNLALTAGQGTWTDAEGQAVDLASYRVVPGDTLTYSQPIGVVLEGDNLKAELTSTGVAESGFDSQNIEVSDPVLTTTAGDPVPATLSESGQFEASISFEFLSTTTGTDDTLSTHDFENVGFKLEQLDAGAAA